MLILYLWVDLSDANQVWVAKYPNWFMNQSQSMVMDKFVQVYRLECI